MKWQQFFEIKAGGEHHVEFLQLCIFDVIDEFRIEVPMFPIILVSIGQIVTKFAAFF